VSETTISGLKPANDRDQPLPEAGVAHLRGVEGQPLAGAVEQIRRAAKVAVSGEAARVRLHLPCGVPKSDRPLETSDLAGVTRVFGTPQAADAA
jgi:hypothetical protein